MDGSAQEIELKFAVSETTAEAVRDYPPLARAFGGREPRRLVSTYFDTRDHRLRQARAVLRVRTDSGRQTLQTLKCASRPGSGAFARPEWEYAITGDRPEPAMFHDPVAMALFAADPAGHDLVPLFETNFERLAGHLHHDGAKSSAPSTAEKSGPKRRASRFWSWNLN